MSVSQGEEKGGSSLELMIALVTAKWIEDKWVQVGNDVMLIGTRAANGAQESRERPPRERGRVGGGGGRRDKRNAADVHRPIGATLGFVQRGARLAPHANASGR